MLRLDWNLLFNIINILILFLLMKRFLFKPVNKIIEQRQKEAEDKLAQAEAAKTSAMETKEKYEASIKDAQDQRTQIIEKAREEASEEYKRIVGEAKGKADDIVEKARVDAQNEKKTIIQQAESEMRDLVIGAVARAAVERSTEENDSALYDKFLDQQ